MQTAADVDIELFNPSCRILVVAPTISQATSCISRIQNQNRRDSPSEPLIDTIHTQDSSGSPPNLAKFPWTITNRYYSAHVHFAVHTMHGLSPHQVQNIPAIIFVWSRGESYKHHIERIAQDLASYEPEVCLAVMTQPQERLSFASAVLEEDGENEDGDEDDSDIDAFLSSHGFEYIDATEEQPPRRDDGDAESNPWSEGVPGLSRVLDALSTIMWPSMQSRLKDPASSRMRDRERVLLDWANSSQDSSLSAVEELAASSSSKLSQRTSTLKNEMQELARWLEEDESLRDDPWKSAASSRGMTGSPTSIEDGEETPWIEQHEAMSLGFEDDFTVFVSAPAVEPAESSGRSTPDAPRGGLSVAPGGNLYRSLGSVSDFGGSDDGRDAGEDAGDGLPTKEEILATSSRIFGAAKFPRWPDVGSSSTIATLENVVASGEVPVASELESFGTEGLGAENDGSYDMVSFDLSKVLSALQEMKAEIAGMADEGERRKAAAKVALGLVYGLEDTESL